MSSSTCLATPGPSRLPQNLKRAMSDAESTPQNPKKLRKNSSTEPGARRDLNGDSKRRRRKRKKVPIVSAGASKNEVIPSGVAERSRAPLSSRNEIIRFTSAPPEADLPAGVVPAANDSSQAPSLKSLGKGRESSSDTLDDIQGEGMPSTSGAKESPVSVNALPEQQSSSLEGDRVAQLEAELQSKNDLITSHQALLNQVQQAVTCQVCLDLMYKPYALAPCGHLACHSCLVNWFTAPPSDNRPAPPAITRRKTCPHCRAVVRERPAEVWGIKSIAQAMGKSGLLSNQLPVPAEAPEGLNANTDPWKDIFHKSGATGQRVLPWFFPGVDVDDDEIHDTDIIPHGEDVGMLDMEDGGIYRCLDCMHEIWDGVCTSCGRVYPGHRRGADEEDDEGNPMGWLEDQTGAEEVDVADDPGWMGLEDGEADDDGDIDEWHPFAPWRRRFHMFREPWGFLGTIHVDEEDEDEEDVDVDGRVSDGGEDSNEEGYESSFIDDNDGEGGDPTDGPRIHEVGDDDEDEDYRLSRPRRLRRFVELVSDDEQDEHEDDVPAHDAVSSDEEANREEYVVPSIMYSQRSRSSSVEYDSDALSY